MLYWHQYVDRTCFVADKSAWPFWDKSAVGRDLLRCGLYHNTRWDKAIPQDTKVGNGALKGVQGNLINVVDFWFLVPRQEINLLD